MNYISPELQEALANRAEKHYSNEMQYHNWQHAQDVMASAALLASTSTHPEIAQNGPLLVITSAWHDADFHLEGSGEFATKEERSAKLAVKSLPELSQADKDLLYSGIIDTTVEKAEKDSLFGEAIHIADLGYFAADHEKFMDRLSLLRAEWGSPEWETTIARTQAFGGHVLEEVRKSIYEILPKPEAEQWLSNISSNLEHVQQQFDSGKLR